jgi:2-polyprenyl-6-methoxyphenol hydroxylase-like FAD-dependent oxidoreductase
MVGRRWDGERDAKYEITGASFEDRPSDRRRRPQRSGALSRIASPRYRDGDRRQIAEGANTSRAAVVHARTLEVLEPLGVVPTMLAEGFRVAVFRVRDRALITIDFQGIPSAYAFTPMCPQDRTEAILLARLKALGGEVIRPAEVTGVGLDASGARVQIAVGNAIQTVAVRWVIGCDGMHSKVREAAGNAFNGAAYEQGFILADVHMDWPLGRGEVR